MAISTLSGNALMQGSTEAAIAGCDRVIALAAGEPDRFIRGQVLMSSYAFLATSRAFDRLDDLLRDLRELTDELDNAFLRAQVANAMAPIIHLTDPAGAGEYLRRGHELNAGIGNRTGSHSTLMFLALHELRTGDLAAAADAARRSLSIAIEYAPAFIAQTVDAIIAIVKRHAPADAAVLLGALRAHRQRRHQVGTETETEAEGRYEGSLRRGLGDEFDTLYAQGLALDESGMTDLALAHLAAIAG
jgi:hypothetical protein